MADRRIHNTGTGGGVLLRAVHTEIRRILVLYACAIPIPSVIYGRQKDTQHWHRRRSLASGSTHRDSQNPSAVCMCNTYPVSYIWPTEGHTTLAQEEESCVGQ